MDVVDILLLCIVGFSVLVFLIVDSHEESRKSCLEAGQTSVNIDSESKTRSWLDDQEENCAKQLVSDNSKSAVFREITEAAAEDSVSASSGRSGGLIDVSENVKIDICKNIEVSECDGKGKDETFDDWEGVERTELEKVFGEAVVFVSQKSNVDHLDGDVKLQLYGLQKVVLEGACHGSQPMALKVSARAKWNAWQKLGNMSREMAMEKYIDILVNAIQGWKGEGARSSED